MMYQNTGVPNIPADTWSYQHPNQYSNQPLNQYPYQYANQFPVQYPVQYPNQTFDSQISGDNPGSFIIHLCINSFCHSVSDELTQKPASESPTLIEKVPCRVSWAVSCSNENSN